MTSRGDGELRFDGRVAIVTGAGRGIGRNHALELAARGAKVVVNDLGGTLGGEGSDPGPATAVAEEIMAAGGEAVASAASVCSEAGAESIVTSAIERFGRVDVVVNNAGNLDPGAMPEMTAADLGRHLDIHVLGSFNVTRAAWPHLTAQRYGRIVMTTSTGLFGGPALVAYSTAKGAVVSLGRSLATGGIAHGVRVNMIAPAAETRMITDPGFRAKVNLPPIDGGAPTDPSRGADQVTPMLLLLAHETCPVNGEILTAGLGRFSRVFVAETRGVIAPGLGPEDIRARWDEIVAEPGYAVHADTAQAVAYREALITAERGPAS